WPRASGFGAGRSARVLPLLGRPLFFDTIVDLLAMDGDALRRLEAHADVVAVDSKHGDGHIVSDHDGLPDPSGENQHVNLLSRHPDTQGCPASIDEHARSNRN